MIRKHIFLSLFLVIIVTASLAQTDDKQAIENLIKTSYVQGVHQDRDRDLIRDGFHENFKINVLMNEDSLLVGSLEMWLSRLPTEPNESEIDYKILDVNVTGSSASAKLEIYQDKELLYTDYMLMYKFPDKWMFVSKIFQRH